MDIFKLIFTPFSYCICIAFVLSLCLLFASQLFRLPAGLFLFCLFVHKLWLLRSFVSFFFLAFSRHFGFNSVVPRSFWTDNEIQFCYKYTENFLNFSIQNIVHLIYIPYTKTKLLRRYLTYEEKNDIYKADLENLHRLHLQQFFNNFVV